MEPGKYKLVEPKLGPRAGDYYPIVAGFDEGDRVVTRGGFLVDSQFQITGKTSLLYPKDDSAAATPDGFTAKEWGNIKKLPKEEQERALAQKICPNCGMNLGALGMPPKLEVAGRTIYLCCNGCGNAVKKDPQAAFDKIEAAKPKDARTIVGKGE